LLFQCRYDDAHRAFQAALECDSNSKEAKDGAAAAIQARDSGRDERERGNAAFTAGNHSAALLHYTAALASCQGMSSADKGVLHSNRSAAHCALGHAKEAIADAREAVCLRPDWAKAHSRLGAALLLANDAAGAAAAFAAAQKLAPDGSAPGAALGAATAADALRSAAVKAEADAAYARGDFRAAADGYTRALTTAPGCAKVLSNRSACYASLGQWDDALADARSALSVDPTWPKAWCRVAAALHGAGNAEAAYALCADALVNRKVANGQQPVVSARDAALEAFIAGATAACRRRDARSKGHPHAKRSASGVRIFVTSDIHVDTNGNLDAWCKRFSASTFLSDVLVVAGDVGDTLTAIRLGLKALRACFGRVFYVPGNHDLWVRPDTDDRRFSDSLCKLFALFDACDALDVDVQPGDVAEGVTIAPLLSWYDATFDEHDPKRGTLLYDKFATFPCGPAGAWQLLLRCNERHVAALEARAPLHDATVVSCSHFLPRAELPCSTGVPELRKNVGCKHLDLHIQRIRASVHVYGHTHVNGDGACGARYVKDPGSETLQPVGEANTTRYVQSALEGGARGLLCVFDRGQPSGMMFGFDGLPMR
jgi:tetratricopeptide (TPR) repeat protein/predicted phosphodiesterase